MRLCGYAVGRLCGYAVMRLGGFTVIVKVMVKVMVKVKVLGWQKGNLRTTVQPPNRTIV